MVQPTSTCRNDRWIAWPVNCRNAALEQTGTKGCQPASSPHPPREDQVNFYVVDKSKEATGACPTKRRVFGFLGCCQGLDRNTWCKTDTKLCHGLCCWVFSIATHLSRLCCRHPTSPQYVPNPTHCIHPCSPFVSRMVATCRPFVCRDCIATGCYRHSASQSSIKGVPLHHCLRQSGGHKEHVLTQ